MDAEAAKLIGAGLAAIGAGIVIMDFIDEDVGCHRNSPQATGDADPSHRIDSHD